MNPISKVAQALGRVANHPINRRRRLKAVLEYGVIQLAARFAPGEICVEFPNQTRILVPPRMKGAAHYIAPRLCELEEMSFVMHFLRPGDFFADVGANIGVFTILAAGVGGARTKSFEPSPDTFEALSRNIRLNGFQERSVAIQAIVGGKEGAAQLSVGLGTENCVATGAAASHSVTVPMTTLDRELAATPPDLLKVDVEGFETEVGGFEGGDGFDAVAALAAFDGDFDFLAGLGVEEGLANGGEVADDAFVRIGVPGAQDGEILGVVVLQIGDGDGVADADDVGAGIGKVAAAGADELGFQFAFAAHEDFLHFLGGLVFVVFAQVAVAAGDGNFRELAGMDFCTSSAYSFLRRSRLSQETTRVVSALSAWIARRKSWTGRPGSS
jgi:FkbM family methyltransferase